MARVTSESFASRLLRSAEEAVRIKDGEVKAGKVTARQVAIPEPPVYSSARVTQIREEIGVSQPVFAQILGVAAATVRSWEQGKRPPGGTARRLLQVMEARPAVIEEVAMNDAVRGRRKG